MNVKLEPAELSMVLKAVEMVIEQQRCPFCDWAPILEHLRNPEPVVTPTETLQQFGPQPRTIEEGKRPTRAKIKRQPPLNPKRWTPEEDAVIHKFNTDGSPIWGSMVLALPSRTVDSIKARYFRLGLDKVSEPPIPEPSVEVPEPLAAVPTLEEIKQELTDLGVPLGEPPVSQPSDGAVPRESTGVRERISSPVATPDSTKEWDWVSRGPSKHKLMSNR